MNQREPQVELDGAAGPAMAAHLDSMHDHLAAGTPLSACPFLSEAGLSDLDPEMFLAVLATLMPPESEGAGNPIEEVSRDLE